MIRTDLIIREARALADANEARYVRACLTVHRVVGILIETDNMPPDVCIISPEKEREIRKYLGSEAIAEGLTYFQEVYRLLGPSVGAAANQLSRPPALSFPHEVTREMADTWELVRDGLVDILTPEQDPS
jgi:hypothetical protein